MAHIRQLARSAIKIELFLKVCAIGYEMPEAYEIDKTILSKYGFKKSTDGCYERAWGNFKFTMFISGGLLRIKASLKDVGDYWCIRDFQTESNKDLAFILNGLFALQISPS